MLIQLRHVPLHRKLTARAAKKGMSLSDYLIADLTPIRELPTMDEWLDQLHQREPVAFSEPAAVSIRKVRELLSNSAGGREIERRLESRIHAPHILDVEIANALRHHRSRQARRASPLRSVQPGSLHASTRRASAPGSSQPAGCPSFAPSRPLHRV